MKTIVVPTDLSPKTDMALSVAVNLARTYGAEIVLLYSVSYPMMAPAFEGGLATSTLEAYDELEQHAQETLQDFIRNPKYADVTITPTLIKDGEGLIRDVTKQPADLIVMGSRGASGLEEWLIGSNAEAIVRYAHCPVLIVKEPISHFQPENIVYAIDIDERLKAIHPYPFQMGELDLHHFLYVLTPSDNRDPAGIRDWVNDLASAKGITDFELTIRSAKSVPDGVIAYADEIKADLIVLYTHGYKGLQHLLLGSIAEDVLNHAQTPVLIMRA